MDHTNVIDGSNIWPNRARILGRMGEAVPSDADLRELRQRYNAAYSAYQSCLIALNDAAATGQTPSPELLKQETAALRELTEARSNLLAAMAHIAKR